MITTNIYRIQAYNLDIFCIGFIDFMLKGKSLTDFTSLFSPNNFIENDDIILNYFQNEEAPNIIYPNLHDQQQFRLNKINEVKYYFIAEIKEREIVNILHPLTIFIKI